MSAIAYEASSSSKISINTASSSNKSYIVNTSSIHFQCSYCLSAVRCLCACAFILSNTRYCIRETPLRQWCHMIYSLYTCILLYMMILCIYTNNYYYNYYVCVTIITGTTCMVTTWTFTPPTN
jgi:hypothetical protein